MVDGQPNGSGALSRDAKARTTARLWGWARWTSAWLLVVVLAACGAAAQGASQVEQQVEQMRAEGIQITNLRSTPVLSKRGERYAENYEFDIPSIALADEPAGTIRIYKDPKIAEAQKKMYAMLGAPGPTTKLDYVTVEGVRQLILNHQLPQDLAQRYIDAFVKTAPSS
jgi:hypothetical protein